MTNSFGHVTNAPAQEAPDVPRENKILKPSDYPSDVDHPKGEWNTMIRKSKSLVLGI